MTWFGLANNIKVPPPLDELALTATLFNRRSNFHKKLISSGNPAFAAVSIRDDGDFITN